MNGTEGDFWDFTRISDLLSRIDERTKIIPDAIATIQKDIKEMSQKTTGIEVELELLKREHIKERLQALEKALWYIGALLIIITANTTLGRIIDLIFTVLK